MKCIIICDNADDTGGVSSVVISQSAALKARGHQVYVFSAYGPVSSLLAENAESVICLYPKFKRLGRLTEIWNPLASERLHGYLKDFSTDNTIIHIHSLSMGLSPSIASVLTKQKIPYVITAHDASWACPTGYFYNFKTQSYCSYKPFSTSCLSCNCDKRTYIHKAFKLIKIATLDYVSHIKQGASALISPSDILSTRLIERTPNTTPVITLLNPVNTQDNGPKTTAGDSFVFVGRIWEEKGINELLEAIGERYPLTVIGDGPNKEALAEKYPKVVFKGWMAPADVKIEMRKAIALILPSIYLEAFGLVVPEALSQGIPTIVSDRAGSVDMVVNGKNGFIVDMSHPDEIRRSCEVLLDKSVEQEMSAYAYKNYWENPLTKDRYIDGLLEIFNTSLRTGNVKAAALD
nr:glycosyltransferase family 4 protein [uncultured Albidiferax sp.]